MKEILVISDLTRMAGDRVCLAGYTEGGMCVRPLFRSGGPNEAWLRQNGPQLIRPFAKVELELLEHTPQRPHSEDWIIDPYHRADRGKLDCEERLAWLSRSVVNNAVADIFGAQLYYGPGVYVRDGEGFQSLGTVRARVHKAVARRRDTGTIEYRLRFADESGASYDLAITDLALRAYLASGGDAPGQPPEQAAVRLGVLLAPCDVYLRVGLGRHWDKYPDRCFLQVNGVFSSPDYLGGRCFADFAATGNEARAPISSSSSIDLFDVPI